MSRKCRYINRKNVLFGTMIMPPHFQLFISSGLAKGCFPGCELKNVDWKRTNKNHNQSTMNRVSRNAEFEFMMLPKSHCFTVTLYATAGLVFRSSLQFTPRHDRSLAVTGNMTKLLIFLRCFYFHATWREKLRVFVTVHFDCVCMCHAKVWSFV